MNWSANEKGVNAMSYAICRVQKIGGAKDITGIQLHNRRERERSNSNPDIDRARSQDNYTLRDCPDISYNALVDKRLKEGYKGKRAIRKDAVKLCEVLFTSDNDFFSQLTMEQQQVYFEECYQWAAERFGRENIISATVHMDEATPHMHVDFVPLTEDGRLSAKSVLGGRKDLQELQDSFYQIVGEHYGLERGKRVELENPEEKTSRHLTTAEYKRQQEQKLQEIEKSVENAEKHLEELTATLTAKEVKRLDVTPKRIAGGFKGLDAKQAQKLVNTAEQQDKQIVRLKKEVKRLTTERDEAIRRAEAAEQKLKPTTSMKNLKKSNEKTEIIRQNELMKQALSIPQFAKYSDIRRYLQDNGLLTEQERKKGMQI